MEGKSTGVGASLARIVGDEISTSCYSSSIGIILFRLVGTYSVSIGDIVTSGNLVFIDEEDSVSAFDIMRRKPLS